MSTWSEMWNDEVNKEEMEVDELNLSNSSDEISLSSARFEYCENYTTTEPAVDIEISIEDNNLDNNLDFYQYREKQVGSTLSIEDSTYKDDNIYLNNNNDIELDSLKEKLKKEACQICTLLPKLQYQCVFATLHKNRYAKNRIELSLWDMLPYKRPSPIFSNKKKSINNNSGNIVLQQQGVEQNETQIDYIKQPNIKVNPCDNVKMINDILSSDRISRQSTLNMSTNNTLSQDLKDKQVIKSTQHGILRPAKLVVENKPSDIDCVTSNNVSVLSSSKLTYIAAKKHKLTSKNLPLGRNVFATSNNNNFQEQVLTNYMQYLEYMQTIKKQKLLSLHKNLNFNTKNNIKETVFKSHGTNEKFSNRSGSKILTDTTENAILSNTAINDSAKVTGAKLNIYEVTLNTHSPLGAVTTNSDTNSQLSGTDDVVVIEAPNEPSTSRETYVVRDTNQVFGGTKRKKLSGKVTSESKKSDENENTVLHASIERMYEELVFIFPNMDKNYIRRICKEYLSREDINAAKYVQLEELIQLILKNERLQLIELNTTTACQKDTDEMYNYLLGIFPDADPVYMKKMVMRMSDNPDALTEFLETQWEHPTYPTTEEKLRRIRIMQQQRQYTSKFDVNQFLEMFPDPFTRFEDVNRTSIYSPDALNFLKYHFNQFKAETILHIYKECKYHLTLTAYNLEKMIPDRGLDLDVSPTEWNLPEDIPLLQECVFIKHKKQIKEHLDKLKEIETIEFERLKERNELLECECCYNTECMPSKCSTCDDGHIFCNSCIQKGVEVKLAEGDTSLSCFINCDGKFNLPTLQKILSPTQFSILISKKQEAEVKAAGLDGLVFCPFCHFASIPPAEDKVFKCLNPECMKESCRLCKKLNHIPRKCYEEESDKARLLLEEKMTEALVRKCHRCARPYFKEEGCNKINCMCGLIMCYLCDKEITGYDHFDTGDSCPLWSDSDAINTATVGAVARETMEHIKKEEPNVNIDASGLLHQLPETSNREIQERVRKVARFDK